MKIGIGIDLTTTRAPSGGGGFSPSDLSPEAWFDPSDTDTITEVSGQIAQIDDKSTNGRHATQSTAVRRPTTGAVTINALNCMGFDAAQIMRLPMAAGTFTNGIQVTFVAQKTGAVQNEESLVNRGSGGSGRPYFRQLNRLYPSSGFYTGFIDLRTITSPTIISWDFTQGSWREFVNGSLFNTETAGTYLDLATTMQIGGRDDERAQCFFRGAIGEIVVTQRLVDEDRQSLEGYLSGKWGV